MTYNLKAVICHDGYSLTSGHYHTFIRKSKQWYHANDAKVRKDRNRATLLFNAFVGL